MNNCMKTLGDFGSFGTFAGPDEELAKAQTALIAYFDKKNQRALPRYGADGYYGTETAEWLKKFQAEKGLPQTGVTDRATLSALGLGNSTAPTRDIATIAKRPFYKNTTVQIGMAVILLAGALAFMKKKKIIFK